MKGGFKTAINGPTRHDYVDVDGTHEIRRAISDIYRTRQAELDQPWHQLLVELLQAK